MTHEVVGNCPLCGDEVIVSNISYKCKKCSFTIAKKISNRDITQKIAREILEQGRSSNLTFISTKTHKQFKACLVLKCGKVEIEFVENAVDNNGKSDKKNEVNLRIESESSGKARFDIEGKIYRELHFGLISARLAECYALIAAINYLMHIRQDIMLLNLNISINGADLAKLLLRESKPRDVEMQEAIEFVTELLSNFKSFKASYQRKKNTRVEGGNLAIFPKGVFTWLDAEVNKEDSDVIISLPLNPAVRAQFKACFPEAKPIEDGFLIEDGDVAEINKWVSVVKDDFTRCNGDVAVC